jgi:plastocyanin
MRISPLVSALALTLAACSGGDTVTGYGGSTAILTTLGISAPHNTLAVAGTMQLSASPKDQNGNSIATTVNWTSGSNFVATVTTSGLVSGVAGGQAYMVAHGGALLDSTLVTVITGAYPSTLDVYMLPLAYTPNTADIAVGATVQFHFSATAHNVFFNTAAGQPADIPGEVANQTVARVFNTKGTFGYRCTLHPEMIATIIVH